MGTDGTGSEEPAPAPPGPSLDLPVRTTSAPAPKQGLTGKQEHCLLTPSGPYALRALLLPSRLLLPLVAPPRPEPDADRPSAL